MQAPKIIAKTRTVALLVFSFLLLATGTSWAQITAIEGQVKGPDGGPLKGALVKIDRKDIKGHYQVKTDKKGHYYYGGLPLGIYKITVAVDGKDADSMDNVKTSLGDPLEMNFDLHQEAARQQALQQAAQTGTLTKEQERSLTPEQKAALEKQAKEQSAALAKNKALNDAFNEGMTDLNAKNYDGAAQAFDKASQMDPSQHVVWAHLADAYVGLAGTKTGADQQAALDKATAAFQKAIALKPDDPAYHNNYALALAKEKKFPEAQAELEKAAQVDPTNAAKYYFNLGAVLVNTGHSDQAADVFKKAIDANPNYAAAQYQYALCLISKATTTPDGKVVPPPGTVEALQKYLQLEPNGAYAESAKGMLQTITGQVSTQYHNPNEQPAKKSRKK